VPDRRFKALLLDDVGLLRMDWNAGYGVEEHCNPCGENAGTWQANRPVECAQHSSSPIHRKPPCVAITKHLIDQTFWRSPNFHDWQSVVVQTWALLSSAMVQ
jgi:hypothetical protein